VADDSHISLLRYWCPLMRYIMHRLVTTVNRPLYWPGFPAPPVWTYVRTVSRKSL